MNLPKFSINPQRVAQSFNRAQKTYDEVAKLQKEVANHLVARFDYIKHEPKTILDIGAGTGFTTRLLEKRFPKASIFAIDIADKLLQVARQKSKWFTKQKFICADALHLPFPNKSFDLIVSNLMLHWCLELDVLFAEWGRVLRSNGLLMFSTLGTETLKELKISWSEVDNEIHVNHFFDVYTLGQTLHQANFIDPVLDIDQFIFMYPDAFKLMRELKLLGGHNINSGRPKTLTGKAKLKKMLTAYEQFRNSQGMLPSTFEVIYGLAWLANQQPFKGKEIEIPVVDFRRKILTRD